MTDPGSGPADALVATMLIDGEPRAGAGTMEVINPATETVVGRMPRASREDLDAAIAAARAAFPAWRDTALTDRRAIVTAAARALAGHVAELAALLTAEQGKPLADSTGEIMGAAYWMEAVSVQDMPVTVIEESPERRVEQRHVPLGVVAAISPWNFPVILALWKVAPALLAGNTVVLKPSPFTPLTILRIGQIIGGIVPAGVLNIVTGGDELGPWMTTHPGVDKVSFTGSTETGRRVMESASATLKRLTLELGGNDAAIVMPDVDLSVVVPDLFWAAFRNSGQICMATKRLYVHDDVYDRFRDALVTYAAGVTMGDGATEGVQLGPIQNAAQHARVQALIDDCRAQGLTFALGGDEEPSDRPGFFIPVTIIDNPPDNSRIVREEQFGPVLPLMRFSDVDDVVRRANDTAYGLAASVWSQDEEAALSIAGRLEVGTAWINEAQYMTPSQPFGGRKQSGLGVESGIDGLLEYTDTQIVTVRRRPIETPPAPAVG